MSVLTAARLADRAEIEDAVKRYCRAVDRCDWALLARFYHPDAVIRHGGYEGAVATRVRAVYRYVDRFERREGRWAVARALLVGGERDTEHFTDAPPDGSAGVGQRPGTDDPLYQMLAELRRAD